MKIFFFGTSGYAVPALRKLHESEFDIAAVVTQPDKPAGRKQLPLPSPVKVWALEHGLKVLQPEKLTPSLLSPFPAEGEKGEGDFSPMIRRRLSGGRFDLFIVASYGKIIPKEILDMPKFGTLNIHPSLLPKYRGPSPIQAAILDGDVETGVTIIKMDEEVDHGDIVAQERITNYELRITNKELHDRLAELGANLLIEVLPKYLNGEIKPVSQNHSQATYTKLITKKDAGIDWSKPAKEIDRQIRAYEAWPVAWTTLDGKRLKIYDASPATSSLPSSISERDKGEVASTADGRILINTGSGQLEILDLQLEGGKRMKAKDFLNGYPGLRGKNLI